MLGATGMVPGSPPHVSRAPFSFPLSDPSQTNAVAVYSTDTWACESSHALKSKKAEWSAVAMCVAPGRPRPLVYFTVEGAPGLRMLDTGIASGAAARDARDGPAVKLKSENRAGILALAAYPGGVWWGVRVRL